MWLMTKGSLWCSFLSQIRSLWSYMWGILWATCTCISYFQSSMIANTLEPQLEKLDPGAFIGILWGSCDWSSPIQMSETGCLTKYTFSLIHMGYSFFPLWMLHVLWKWIALPRSCLFQPPLMQTEFDRCRKYMYKHDCMLLKSCFGDGTEKCFV